MSLDSSSVEVVRVRRTIMSGNPWNKTASPWGKSPAAPPPCSLEEIMSEELARELQKKEEESFNQELMRRDQLKQCSAAAPEPSEIVSADSPAQLTDEEMAAKLAAEDTGYDPNDEIIARMLQKEFDREYDSQISKKEQKFNGNSKVSISFENYKRRHNPDLEGGTEQNEEDDDDDYYEELPPEYPAPTNWETPPPAMGKGGYIRQGNSIITKHDKTVCGRRNAERMMEFPPGFGTGDGEGMDLQLSNKIYNKLKKHSQSESRKTQKLHEKKDHSTAMKAVDEKTRIIIFKLINAEFLTSVDGVVSEGKEAVVFKAIGGRKDDVELPRDVILKIYKTTMNEFKTRLQYINGDYRLSKDALKKFNPRKLMRKWAEKEFMNLNKLRRNGVPCPEALTLKKHVLAMTCIGGENPAPKLRDTVLSLADLEDAYKQTVELMKTIYHKCNMVHADFSPYNLLWHEGKVWVIDVGQAVDRDNVNSDSFFLRDCKNICDFFRLRGVHEVPTAEGLFNEITHHGISGEGKLFESQVHRYEKEKYAFDYFFDLTSEARLQKLDLDSDSDSEDDDDDDLELDGGGVDGRENEKSKNGECEASTSSLPVKSSHSKTDAPVVVD